MSAQAHRVSSCKNLSSKRPLVSTIASAAVAKAEPPNLPKKLSIDPTGILSGAISSPVWLIAASCG